MTHGEVCNVLTVYIEKKYECGVDFSARQMYVSMAKELGMTFETMDSKGIKGAYYLEARDVRAFCCPITEA